MRELIENMVLWAAVLAGMTATAWLLWSLTAALLGVVW